MSWERGRGHLRGGENAHGEARPARHQALLGAELLEADQPVAVGIHVLVETQQLLAELRCTSAT